MIAYSPRALRQIKDLCQHYENLERIEAIRGLFVALAEAERKIAAEPAAGFPAPRPYPDLSRPVAAWVKAGHYWIGYTTTAPLTIASVFYETANIPGRY